MKSISDINVHGERVFLRVDFNVPIIDGKIEDDNRIKAVLPTINYLIGNKAKVVIGTHIGRPEGQRSSETSVKPIADHLSKLINRKVQYVDDVLGPQVESEIGNLKDGELLMLANLRWYKEEEENNTDFASKLASYGDIYVNDAFAVSHRSNASVDAITAFLPSYAGLLLESEVTTLKLLFDNPVSPFVAIIGGAKIKDKAGVIKTLGQKADRILVGGAVANTFLQAKGENVGKSLVESDMLDECRVMIEALGTKLVLPEDATKEEKDDNFDNLDLGPQTISKYRSIILEAGSIFWNGNLGYTEKEEFAKGTYEIAKAVGESKCENKVAAGGDTVGFINDHHLAGDFSFLSTGGGAALEFLAGEKLPGIEALNN